MSNYEDPQPNKKVTAATTDAPQEEFISQESIPSHPEDSGAAKPKPEDAPPGPDNEQRRENRGASESGA